MKKIILLASLILVTISSGISQDLKPYAYQISVLGSVELRETATQASFTFSVKGVGSSLRQAVEDANKKVKAVTGKLMYFGVREKNISTSQFYTGENLGDKAFLSSSRDYQATLTTLVTVDSFSLLDSIIYAASESDVKDVSNITFSLKDESVFRKQARIEAAIKAREKAQDFAKALGVTLGPVISIEEVEPTRVLNQQRAGNYPNPFNPPTRVSPENLESSSVDEIRGTGMFAQTIVVTSQVRAAFSIVPSQ
ncbi:MAG TPA: SIMPL domain-containing protein [Bacteroidota bacterium]|nr:SIMPL domain-containing protein [Bacteroidota bacterium]